MSTLMRNAMDIGTFWLSLALRKSWDVDQIYWSQLHRINFGGDSGHPIEFIADPKVREGLEGFTEMKLKQYEKYYEESLENSEL
jgi:hypothetical protein